MCEVVICDLDHKDINEEMNVFSREGLDLLWLHCKTQEEVIERCLGARVLLNQYVRMDRKIFEALPSVKCVIRYGVGYDNVSLEDAAAYGVQICNISAARVPFLYTKLKRLKRQLKKENCWKIWLYTDLAA